MRLAAVLTLAGLLPLTQGCIAAAIPLAAGATMAKMRSDRSSPAPAPASALAQARVAAAGDRSDLRVVPTSLSALPAPDFAASKSDEAIKAFENYASGMADIAPGQGPRTSALLTDPGDLDATRIDCGSRPPAVFVDLDPGRGTFDPLSPGNADPELGKVLVSLRAKGMAVVWLSRLGENFASAARAALAQGGLDRAGRDTLVLMRDLGERKQTRRDAIAQELCPVAILGDERADFDELYLYLKNPDSAFALDASIGKGWFLASPFVGQPTAALAGVRP